MNYAQDHLSNLDFRCKPKNPPHLSAWIKVHYYDLSLGKAWHRVRSLVQNGKTQAGSCHSKTEQ